MISRRKRSISSAAMLRKLSSSASPDSSCSLSISSVLRPRERVAVLVEVAEQRQAAVLERAGAVVVLRGGSRRCSRRPAWRSTVLLQTTMKQGGTLMPASCQSSKVFS